MRYKATVVDLIPGVDDDKRAAESSAEGYGSTVEQAEQDAIAKSAVNCNRRVYVDEADAPFRTVKGPYTLKAAKC